jgi:hypothetical protein
MQKASEIIDEGRTKNLADPPCEDSPILAIISRRIRVHLNFGQTTDLLGQHHFQKL